MGSVSTGRPDSQQGFVPEGARGGNETGVTAPAPGELDVTEAGVIPMACPVVDGAEALGISNCCERERQRLKTS